MIRRFNFEVGDFFNEIVKLGYLVYRVFYRFFSILLLNVNGELRFFIYGKFLILIFKSKRNKWKKRNLGEI